MDYLFWTLPASRRAAPQLCYVYCVHFKWPGMENFGINRTVKGNTYTTRFSKNYDNLFGLKLHTFMLMRKRIH